MTGFTMAPPRAAARSPTGGYQRIPGQQARPGFAPASAASMGRGGDDRLAHVNPVEAQMLEALGGSGTRNPMTGLREYVNPALIPAFLAMNRMASGMSSPGPAGGAHAGMHQAPGAGAPGTAAPPGQDRNAMGQALLQAVLSGKFGG